MAKALGLTTRQALIRLRRDIPFIMSQRGAADVTIWRPGPRPRTKAEIERAAAKYNMIPEDYDMWDEDMCLGDYPKFTPITYPARDPWYEWDNEAARENYGEPIPLGAEVYYGVNKDYSPDQILEIPLWKLFLISYGSVVVLAIVAYINIVYDLSLIMPFKPQNFPGHDKVHYTFEPAE